MGNVSLKVLEKGTNPVGRCYKLETFNWPFCIGVLWYNFVFKTYAHWLNQES